MDEIHYTLLSDGSSDRALLPILTWTLREQDHNLRIQAEWADLRHLTKPPRNLYERILAAIDLFPCDLLFVHRDAERQEPQQRYEEIHEAIKRAAENDMQIPTVCVVPVQMTEAWLLFDETAIRHAAGNPNGINSLNIPALTEIEEILDPKSALFDILKIASGRTGRRLKKFNVGEARLRISELIFDFSPLRGLSAFQRLEEELSLRLGDL